MPYQTFRSLRTHLKTCDANRNETNEEVLNELFVRSSIHSNKSLIFQQELHQTPHNSVVERYSEQITDQLCSSLVKVIMWTFL